MIKIGSVVVFIILTTGAWAQVAIQGTVRDAETNLPLAGATVQLSTIGRIYVTNDQGAFYIENIPMSEYSLIVKFLGYETKYEKFIATEGKQINITLTQTSKLTDEVIITATRATEKTPIVFQNINKQTIQQQNFGQDIPFILNWTPSLVTTSDAGTGIGYTGMRIRGSDATRINVTINGIPLNDSESQGLFWVNTPDLASSTESVQIQRGVGTSTNGSGAFGASVNIETNTLRQDAYAQADVAVGSFNTQRYTFKMGSGLIQDHWVFDARVSSIQSSGYVDRAFSDLNSLYLSGGYYGDKTIVKAIMMRGHEVTYQAYYGLDAQTLNTNRTFNYAGALYDTNYNVDGFYDRQVDDYAQDHFQLHIAQALHPFWTANVSLHYTYGRGYYEQYLQENPFAEIGVPDLIINDSLLTTTDMIEKRWLDNDFYGTTFSIQHDREKMNLIMGGAYNTYTDAKHFGEIIWAQYASLPKGYRYYQGESAKNDVNVYAKLTYEILPKLSGFIDMQHKSINYKTIGIDNDLTNYSIRDNFNFFNPKAGLTYQWRDNNILYASFAIAQREPNRSDYLDGQDKPTREKLNDWEVGWRRNTSRYQCEFNYYFMQYKDQLVLTGEINDVGYPIRANIGKSYRTGIELAGQINVSDKLLWNANITTSINRNIGFPVVNTSNGETEKHTTTIVLSPSVVVGSQLTWKPLLNTELSLLSKYVSSQYLDNTESSMRQLNGYFVNDIRFTYRVTPRFIKQLDFSLLINNVLNTQYSSNGYVYDSVPYFFPQAGIHFLSMVSFSF